ncbi:Cytochrome P450 [Corchorus olitorius]|uniref:Cytochrome P450 n=1 Tax=Corchorus olitorius TaxID=93759 RepID=A0A1R3KAN3_9ROSI|nr:Cytochrome P450 [Corchorus olitorius]
MDLLSSSSLLSSPITLAVTLSIASYFLIPILLGARRQNWKNAPPGPVGLPIFGNLFHLSQRFHEEFYELAKIYGPLFSLNLGLKPAIVVSSPEMAMEVMKEKEGMFSSRTITEAIRVVSYDAHSIIFSPYGPRWKALRRILISELFSPKAFEQFEPLRTKQVHSLLKYLYHSKSNTQINIAEAAFTALANLVSNIVCSKNLFDNSKPEGRKMKEMFWELIKVIGTPNFSDLIPVVKPLDTQGLKRRISRVFNQLDAFYEKLIEERLAERAGKAEKLENVANTFGKMDMLDVLLSFKSNDKENGFMVESDIPNLPYLQATVKEVFRLHPAVPLIIPRRSNEGCEVAGYNIPKHCIVYVNVWGMARDPKVWDNPLEFKPERFLGSTVDVKGQDFNLLPFGTGRRSCVGWPLAHRMVHYYLAALLHAFEWESPPEILNDMHERIGLTIQKDKSLLSTPKPRLPPSVYEYN